MCAGTKVAVDERAETSGIETRKGEGEASMSTSASSAGRFAGESSTTHEPRLRALDALSSLRALIMASMGSIAVSGCGGRSLPGDGELVTAGGAGGRVPIAGRGGTGRGGIGQGGTGPGGMGQGGTGPGGTGGNYGRGGAERGGSGPGGAGGTGSVVPGACHDPEALGGGFLRCASGMIHRIAPAACDSRLPRAAALSSEELFELEEIARARGLTPEQLAPLVPCFADEQCREAPHGYCVSTHGLADALTQCVYGCVRDEECGSGNLCFCGDPVGTCVPGLCESDRDCAGALLCTAYDWAPGCDYGSGVAFACQTYEDECASDADCRGDGRYCGSTGSQRACVSVSCPVPGRPFLVDDAPRVAAVVSRDDWVAPGPAGVASPSAPVPGDPELRQKLARAWEQQGAMEHASIAAFARFALQLLALGAPAELVAAAAQALDDERRHAEACFALASRYGGGPVGPGPLDVGSALGATDLESCVLSALHEGCVGETLAALEAAEAAEHCADESTRAVLRRIAAEEAQHAALAWRFLAWALPRCSASTVDRVRAAFAAALSAAMEPSPPARIGAFDRQAESGGELLPFGIVSPALGAELRRRSAVEALLPCAELLLGSLEGDWASTHPPPSRPPALAIYGAGGALAGPLAAASGAGS